MGPGTSWPGYLPLTHIYKSIHKWLKSFYICPKRSIPTATPASQLCHLLHYALISNQKRLHLPHSPLCLQWVALIHNWCSVHTPESTWITAIIFPPGFPISMLPPANPSQHCGHWLTGMMILHSQIFKTPHFLYNISTPFRLCKTFHSQASFLLLLILTGR